RPPGFTPFRKA
uniref:Megascoliakinin n=2 Tax=Bilateria TaxID=33213 RepID=BRK_MEGFL|nr:RecName: Full=Megascoliakinin; Short=MBK; AltName: Full=Thr6-bradykinin-Lys-Ala; Contains: RecName: Full=Thr6-bradykinin; AltName: Full=Bradykinin-like peptide; AltName: Full=Bradykinin-related peptide [Megascolia flavifrons]